MIAMDLLPLNARREFIQFREQFASISGSRSLTFIAPAQSSEGRGDETIRERRGLLSLELVRD
jgi:hypothetical protein